MNDVGSLELLQDEREEVAEIQFVAEEKEVLEVELIAAHQNAPLNVIEIPNLQKTEEVPSALQAVEDKSAIAKDLREPSTLQKLPDSNRLQLPSSPVPSLFEEPLVQSDLSAGWTVVREDETSITREVDSKSDDSVIEAMVSRSWDLNSLAISRETRISKEDYPLSPFRFLANDSPRKWSVHASVGPAVNYRTFDSPNSEFTNHKNESDESLLSANAELLFHYRPSDQWMFSLGIGQLNMGEKYAFTLNEQTHRFTNEYHYITIPVRVRHRILDISSTFNLFLGTGAQMGFLQEGVSSWIDLASEQAVTHSNKGSESPFREQVISAELDLMLTADVSNRIFLSLQERATYSLNSIYKSETQLDQRPFSFDTLFGLGYRF
jgi:hypothetical protein